MAKKLTQTDMVLDMIKRDWVTPLDALRECGCFRLGARILELTQQGYKIERGWYEYASAYGQKKVRKYRLVQKQKEEQLKLLN